jgi:hypothetical protein
MRLLLRTCQSESRLHSCLLSAERSDFGAGPHPNSFFFSRVSLPFACSLCLLRLSNVRLCRRCCTPRAQAGTPEQCSWAGTQRCSSGGAKNKKSLSVTQPWERNALFSVHLSPMHPGSVGSAPSMWPVDAVLCGAGRPWQPDPIQHEKCRPAETSEQNECNCNRWPEQPRLTLSLWSIRVLCGTSEIGTS